MSELIAIRYPDVATADLVRQRVFDLQREQLIQLADAVVVERRADGTTKLHQAASTTGAGAVSGMMFGGLIGLLFFMPLVGMAVGGATGAAVGATADVGVDDAFMRQLGQQLTPGSAALFLLIVDGTPDKVIPRLAPMGGELLHTSLSHDSEMALRDAVDAARTTAAVR